MTGGGQTLFGDKQKTTINHAVSDILGNHGTIELDGTGITDGASLTDQLAESNWIEEGGLDSFPQRLADQAEDIQGIIDTAVRTHQQPPIPHLWIKTQGYVAPIMGVEWKWPGRR